MSTSDPNEVAVTPASQRVAPKPRSPKSDWRAGVVMVGVAIVGVAVALSGTAVAWQLTGELTTSSRETLDVTIETIDSLEDSIDLADDVLSATTESIDTASTALTALAESFDAGTGVVDEIERLTNIVGPTLGDAAVTLRQLEDVGSTIDQLLGDFSSIPFAPDYRPDRELGETIGDVATEIEKLPSEFDQTAESIGGFGTALDEVKLQLERFAVDIDAVNDGLTDTSPLIAGYRRNVSDARAAAIDARAGIDDNLAVMRLLLVLGGIVFAVGQLVPFWFGRELIERSKADVIADVP